MAYNKRTWANGNVVGAVDLNRMEQGIEDASGDSGFSCTETRTLLTEETITTAYDSATQANTGTLTYSQYIDVDKLKITFNGTEYELERIDNASKPFVINYSSEDAPCSVETKDMIGTITNTLIVPNAAGTYTIKIEVPTEVVNTTECFEKAVKSVAGDGKFVVGIDTTSNTLDKTWQEIYDAMSQGKSAAVRFKSAIGEDISEYPIINVNSVDTYAVRVIFPPTGTGTNAQIVTFTATSSDDYPKKSGGAN